jgi:hypothetical protein
VVEDLVRLLEQGTIRSVAVAVVLKRDNCQPSLYTDFGMVAHATMTDLLAATDLLRDKALRLLQGCPPPPGYN